MQAVHHGDGALGSLAASGGGDDSSTLANGGNSTVSGNGGNLIFVVVQVTVLSVASAGFTVAVSFALPPLASFSSVLSRDTD